VSRPRRAQRIAPLPSTDLDLLRQRVRAVAENRPAIYRMTDALGRVLYVGKAKRLRTRLLTYFRAEYPDDKAARILYAASDITWDYVPSEFAAYLRRAAADPEVPAPLQLSRERDPSVGAHQDLGREPSPARLRGRHGGFRATLLRAFLSFARPQLEAVRTLNDLLGLRDCTLEMPAEFAGQRDLFDQPRQARCMRHEFGFCGGPCAGLVTQLDYRRRIETAMAFLEGRTIQPIDRVVAAMQAAADEARFEAAARWRERFEHLEWLLAATQLRARRAIC
jgi:excinuclease ABC subunit C